MSSEEDPTRFSGWPRIGVTADLVKVDGNAHYKAMDPVVSGDEPKRNSTSGAKYVAIAKFAKNMADLAKRVECVEVTAENAVDIAGVLANEFLDKELLQSNTCAAWLHSFTVGGDGEVDELLEASGVWTGSIWDVHHSFIGSLDVTCPSSMELVVVAVARMCAKFQTGQHRAWRKALARKVFSERSTRFILDIISLPEFREDANICKAADRLARLAVHGEGRRMLEAGLAHSWARKYPGHLAAFLVTPRYLFDAIAAIPEDIRRCKAFDNLDFLEPGLVLTFATSSDLSKDLWMEMIVHKGFGRYRDWAMAHPPALTNTELASLSIKGGREIKQWVIKQWAKERADDDKFRAGGPVASTGADRGIGI